MMEDLDRDRMVMIEYTNWRGEKSTRKIIPEKIYFGNTEWHPHPGWLLVAFDLEKGEMRHFALKDIHNWSDRIDSLISL